LKKDQKHSKQRLPKEVFNEMLKEKMAEYRHAETAARLTRLQVLTLEGEQRVDKARAGMAVFNKSAATLTSRSRANVSFADEGPGMVARKTSLSPGHRGCPGRLQMIAPLRAGASGRRGKRPLYLMGRLRASFRRPILCAPEVLNKSIVYPFCF
jgi:hypothetical protein